jgi:Pregnancy-associated plasma protein-A/Secretion system C-terminal sorting domain
MNGSFKFFVNISTLFTILLLAFSADAQIQRTCAAEEILQRQLANDPLMRQVREELEKRIQGKQGAQDRGSMVITIPVVVNVLWNTAVENISDAQIQSQLDVLNADFRLLNDDALGTPAAFALSLADCEINFCLARRDPTGCLTNGIRRRETTKTVFYSNTDNVKFTSQGGLDIWDRDQYLNIWVCNMNSNPIAYAQFPGGSASTDGIVVDYRYFGTIGTATAPFNLGRSATHEIGHWLNCFHIWGDDESSCSGTDMVGDTPNQADENYGCPSFPQVSCSNGPTGDMFMNYMDYVDDACMFMFTNGQKTRMQATFEAGGPRNAILNSKGCQAPCPCTTNVITHINTNTLYNIDMNMPGDIHVHSGSELIIEAKIGMRQGTRILVERNARLVIDNGGVVTKGCDTPDWAGIQVLGNIQKVQPSYNGTLTDPDQAGIVWIDNGTVEWARTGVTAGGGYGSEFWGGLIWTNKATFQNNRKDVEFMQYKLPFNPLSPLDHLNKSRFSNTQFLTGLPTVPYANREGITIWETDGIEFNKCNIYSKGMQGIRTYDAGIKVHNGCSIESNQIGISCYATYPMSYKSVIGTTTAENNFYGNFYDVYASTATGWFGLYNPLGGFSMDVINNNFEGSLYGVVLDGPSNFRIGGNKFVDVEISAWTANTGFNNVTNQNLIGCNRIDARRNIGILAIGDNKQMQFLGNDFIDGWTTARDFVLTNSFFPNNNGSIQALQGKADAPAGNCFSDPGNQIDILTAGQWGGTTDFFTYYYEADEPPLDCDPEPINLGNYEKNKVVDGIFTVDCSKFGGLPIGLEDPKNEDLDIKRQQLQTLVSNIQTDANAKVKYYQVLAEKEAILKYLVSKALNEKDFATAETLLAGEQGKAAQWAIFGLRMGRQDYTGAAQLLNQLPTVEVTDVQFRDIQLINLQRLQNLSGFELSVTQEAYLNSVADGYSPIRGYARGILGLLKDRVYFPDEYEIMEERSLPIEYLSTETLKVYPVPASDQLVANWPTLPESADAQLQVFDLLGRQHLSQAIGARETNRVLGVANLPEGVYFLVISNTGKVAHRAKFTVQH